MLFGRYTHNIDTKSRVFVPAKLRPDLGDRFYVSYSPLRKCLRAYSEHEWEIYADKLSMIELDPDGNIERLISEIMEYTTLVDVDSQGRIPLSADQLAKVGITDKALFIGNNRWAEIWSPEGREKYIAPSGGAESRLMAEQAIRNADRNDAPAIPRTAEKPAGAPAEKPVSAE